MNKMKHALAFAGVSFLLFGAGAHGSAQSEKIVAEALASDLRTAEEKARDPERKPLETLSFFGLEPDMTVVELLPGGGWYTKILAQTLADKGQLYLALGTGRVKEKLPEWQFDKVKILAEKSELVPTSERGIFDVKAFDLDVKNVDMVLTFRNAHNLTPEARAELNTKVFNALKPGGVYAVVDHTRRHMQPYSRDVWRRLDPVLVIKEALDAGFEFDGFSDLHFQPDDSLEFDTRAEQMTGPSDRFTLRFRKPK